MLFKNPINFGSYKTDPLVIREATEIGNGGRLGKRTRAEKLDDALNGIALQYAVRQELAVHGAGPGWDILDPLDKTHDIRLQRADGRMFLIDVKGRFTLTSQTLTINRWEMENADPSTVYLVFDCVDDLAGYRGWFTLWDAEEGRYGPMVWLSALKKTNPFV